MRKTVRNKIEEMENEIKELKNSIRRMTCLNEGICVEQNISPYNSQIHKIYYIDCNNNLQNTKVITEYLANIQVKKTSKDFIEFCVVERLRTAFKIFDRRSYYIIDRQENKLYELTEFFRLKDRVLKFNQQTKVGKNNGRKR